MGNSSECHYKMDFQFPSVEYVPKKMSAKNVFEFFENWLTKRGKMS